MIYADSVTFKTGASKSAETIDLIHLVANGEANVNVNLGWQTKEYVHDRLKDIFNLQIKCATDPNPLLVPREDGFVRYVQSVKDDTEVDNLVNLG